MDSNYHQQGPFWDFVRSFDHQNGRGYGADVDHPAGDFNFFAPPPYGPTPDFVHHGFPFGDPPHWGPRGFGPGPRGGYCGRGRHGHRREGSQDRHGGSREGSPNPEASEGEAGERRRGPQGPRGFGRHGRGRNRGWGQHGHGHGRRGPPPPFGGPAGPGGFDLSALLDSLSAHPLAQAFRDYATGTGPEAQRSGETQGVPDDADTENTFIPPIDIFSTEKQFVLHVSLPGAKREDVGVNWDEDKGVLNLAGVVYRHGDEEFLQTLSQAERKVGVFERTVKLPPGNGEKEEINGDAITAKLEDGVLVVTVPKIEKEWTEVKRVDIE